LESWEIKKWLLIAVGAIIVFLGFAFGTETKVEAVKVATQTSYIYDWSLIAPTTAIGFLLVFIGLIMSEDCC